MREARRLGRKSKRTEVKELSSLRGFGAEPQTGVGRAHERRTPKSKTQFCVIYRKAVKTPKALERNLSVAY